MLELLVKQKEILGLKGGARCASTEGGISWKSLKKLPTTSPEDKVNLHGRDVEKEEIIKFLLSDNDGSNRVPVLSIVGLGGMGKTTLAEVVYNDDRIKEHFERIAWVYVSEYFDAVRLTKEIISRCEFCSRFPSLGQLPSLKELYISECDGIEIIGEEFYGYNSSIIPFSSLESLGFDNMYGWNEWLCPKGFPSLKVLFITECPKLKRALPQHLPCLERLVIFECPGVGGFNSC
ncbi:CC-NBS-LRR resistance protein [Trifolium pratense]|uniref:CC-NBS-LRR resistance protein n=1 Tax=Trifolium pratense TaxID=57577 RepID=A0A2K3KAF2_TRIPR|nr:CC-NBS-LRR resistance protein [Trifolium pratense]